MKIKDLPVRYFRLLRRLGIDNTHIIKMVAGDNILVISVNKELFLSDTNLKILLKKELGFSSIAYSIKEEFYFVLLFKHKEFSKKRYDKFRKAPLNKEDVNKIMDGVNRCMGRVDNPNTIKAQKYWRKRAERERDIYKEKYYKLLDKTEGGQ